MDWSIAFAISSVGVCTKFDQRLNIFDVQRNHSEMKSSGSLFILLRDIDLMYALEKKYRNYAIIHLGGTMVHCLLIGRFSIDICVEMHNQRIDH